MKSQKIKTMKTRPDISDEEIAKMMDFDFLLKQHAQQTRSSSWKWWTASAILVLIGGWYAITQLTSPTIETSVTSGNTEPTHPQAQDSTQTRQDEPVSSSVQPTPVPKVDHTDKEPTPTTSVRDETTKVQEEKTTAVDVYLEAEPVNGYPELYEYFRRELHYPEIAVKDSIEGVVSVSFVVGKTGQPEQLKIVQSLGPAFDEEAKRIIMGMPAWQPATLNGKPVPAKVSLPLTFHIQTKPHP